MEMAGVNLEVFLSRSCCHCGEFLGTVGCVFGVDDLGEEELDEAFRFGKGRSGRNGWSKHWHFLRTGHGHLRHDNVKISSVSLVVFILRIHFSFSFPAFIYLFFYICITLSAFPFVFSLNSVHQDVKRSLSRKQTNLRSLVLFFFLILWRVQLFFC